MSDDQDIEIAKVRLDFLMGRFAQNPVAEVGRGPEHPDVPNIEIEGDLNDFLRDNSFLSRDAGYITFLRRYCGASIYNHADGVVVDLSGLAGVSLDLLATPEDFVDGEGFAGFAVIELSSLEGRTGKRVTSSAYFSMDATNSRRAGVFRSVDLGDGQMRPWEWHSQSFLDWLEIVVRDPSSLISHS